jgi:hypothetical protein
LHFDVAVRFGLARYDLVASGWELGEALYFALYEPVEADEILSRTVDHLLAKDQTRLADLCNANVLAELDAATLAAVKQLDLPHFRLSVGALQLGAAMYLAHLIHGVIRDPEHILT